MSAMLAAMLEAEFLDDFEDARVTMADRPGFRDRPMGGLTHIAVHHTVGAKSTPWTAIRDGHWNRKPVPFAGIGYHIGIRQGVVSYLGNVEQARACVAQQNHKVVCVCIAGDYEGDPRKGKAADPLDRDDLDALRRVVAVLDAFLGRELPVVGHGQVPGGPATQCPGKAVLAVLPTIRQVSAPSPDKTAAAWHARLKAEAPGREVIGLNPAAGLTRTILADRYAPTSPEFDVTADDGTAYVAQVAQGVKAGRVVRRVYLARRPDWSIRFVDV